MEYGLYTCNQWQEGANSQAETMEGWQRVEDRVGVGIQANMSAHLLDVRNNVLVAEHNALRFAFSARREQNDSGLFRRLPGMKKPGNDWTKRTGNLVSQA